MNRKAGVKRAIAKGMNEPKIQKKMAKKEDKRPVGKGQARPMGGGKADVSYLERKLKDQPM